MLRQGIVQFISHIKNRQALLNRSVISCTHYNAKCSTKANNTKDDNDERDKPVKYSTSEAANWPACGTGFRRPDIPTAQPFVIVLSLYIFFIYFAILREENDIDEKLINGFDPEAQKFLFGIQKQQEKIISEYRKSV